MKHVNHAVDDDSMTGLFERNTVLKMSAFCATNVPYLVTFPTFQLERFWLKDVAPPNMELMLWVPHFAVQRRTE